MFTTKLLSISELEAEARRTDNHLALQLISKIDEIIDSLEIMKVEGVENREIEYIRRICNLENNW